MPFKLATAFVRHQMKNASASHGAMHHSTGILSPGVLAAQSAQAAAPQISSLAGLGAQMQQEAAGQNMDQQLLAAQQEANSHLGTLADCAGGSAIRVQVVGAQPAQW